MNKAFSSYKTRVLWKASLKREGKSGAQEDGRSEFLLFSSPSFKRLSCRLQDFPALRQTEKTQRNEIEVRADKSLCCQFKPRVGVLFIVMRERSINASLHV